MKVKFCDNYWDFDIICMGCIYFRTCNCYKEVFDKIGGNYNLLEYSFSKGDLDLYICSSTNNYRKNNV